MTKIDFEKDRRKRLPKDFDFDGMPRESDGVKVQTTQPSKQGKVDIKVAMAELKSYLKHVEEKLGDDYWLKANRKAAQCKLEDCLLKVNAYQNGSAPLPAASPLLKKVKQALLKLGPKK